MFGRIALFAAAAVLVATAIFMFGSDLYCSVDAPAGPKIGDAILIGGCAR